MSKTFRSPKHLAFFNTFTRLNVLSMPKLCHFRRPPVKMEFMSVANLATIDQEVFR